ncbi:MAG: ATP-binding cassette domain-containing protein, partial [Corynebacterium sp.]|nr:ATP-binding cassette domain-containing protein [Corynebacterium sp.]
AIEEVIDAARSAQIHQRIQRLPEGYDAVVGAATTQLSGGEQQRLTLARALLRDSPIVLLDEATAYVDPHSEREIQQALSALTRNRTVIVIAHRLASIVGVDNIVVLDRGRVVEQGTHQELMALGGVYQELWEAQQ